MLTTYRAAPITSTHHYVSTEGNSGGRSGEVKAASTAEAVEIFHMRGRHDAPMLKVIRLLPTSYAVWESRR